MSLVHNEQTKLTATAVSNVALALFVGGFVAPVVSASFGLSTAPAATAFTISASFVWFFAGVSLHAVARSILRRLRP